MKSSETIKNFILENNHPCVMAQSIFEQNQYMLKNYDQLGTETTARKILVHIGEYLNSYNFSDKNFYTFIAAFPEESFQDELEFENTLWKQLRFINSLDIKEWDSTVSSNPESNKFSFSILGKAFYIVGMHPNSSRNARRSPFPCIVFNLHSQFEMLRNMNVYERVRNRIRHRDKEQNGSVNPMLMDFGESSEARQYSGRHVDKNWKCPFKPE